MKVDLHMHTTYSSDGQHSLDEVLQKIETAGIHFFSVTDHNVMGAYDELLKTAVPTSELSEKNTQYITGTELSTYVGETEIHLLAYGLSQHSELFLSIQKEFLTNRDKQTRKRVEALQQLGFLIEHEEIMATASGKAASGVTFLKVLQQHSENLDKLSPYLDGEKSNSPYTNFYFDYFFRGGKAHVYVPLLDYTKVVEQLKDHAVLVIAHPGLYPESVLEDLAVDGISGVEVFSTYHDAEKIKRFSQYAERHGWLRFAGSDFHGHDIKPGIDLGCVDNMPNEDFVKMLQEVENKGIQLYRL